MPQRPTKPDPCTTAKIMRVWAAKVKREAPQTRVTIKPPRHPYTRR